jgi:cell division protein FtsL
MSRSRLNLVLLLVLLGSALYLVRTSYESRRLFVELERERAVARKLESEADRLTVERRAQATNLRVEKVAREQLQMRTANASVTQYVVPPAEGATAGAAPGARASAAGARAASGEVR